MNDIYATTSNIISERDLVISKEIIAYAAESFIVGEYDRLSVVITSKDDFLEILMLITLSVFDLAKEDNVDTSSCQSFLAIVMEVRNYVKDVIVKYVGKQFFNKV